MTSENHTQEFRYALDNDDLKLVQEYDQYNPVPPFKILQYTLLRNLPNSFSYYLEKEDLELDFNEIRTLVNQAAAHPESSYLENLLKKFDDHDLNQPTNHYKSMIDYLPLNTAIYEKRMVNVENLLEYGAKSDLSYPKDGQTSLHLAVIIGHQGIMQFLLENLDENNLDPLNNRFNSPLHLAALKTDLGLVKLLVESGANLDLKNKNGYTPYDLVTLNQDSDPEDKKLLSQYFEINQAQSTIGESLVV